MDGGIDVWWARPGDAAPSLVDLLDDVERLRLARIVQDADRDRYLVAHALARLTVAAALAVDPGQVEFDRACIRCGAAHGKPRVRRPARPVQLTDLDADGDHLGCVAALAAAPVPVVERDGSALLMA